VTFFLFLFFFVFFSLVFLGIQSATRISSSRHYVDESSVGVGLSEVQEIGDANDLSNIISATERRARNTFFSLGSENRLAAMSDRISQISAALSRIQLEMFVFKMMIGGLALLMGLISAFLALTGTVIQLK
jgi:hypothetical protein